MTNFTTVPTENIDLLSKGLLYPEENVLSKGVLEMKHMSARDEDILTNINFIKQGVVLDKLLQAMIVTPINFDDLLICDKNIILISARILGYGKDYTFTYTDKRGVTSSQTIDLTQLKEKFLDEKILLIPNVNNFEFTLSTGTKLTFKFLTHGDEKKIENEIKGLKKFNPNGSYDATTRLKHIITSVNGDSERKTINEFVDKSLTALEAREFRQYISSITPDVKITFTYEDGDYVEEDVDVPVGLDFFYPDSRI